MELALRCIPSEVSLQLKIISKFCEPVQNDVANINLHSVRLCLYLAYSPTTDATVLSDLRIMRHVGAALHFVHVTGMQEFLDPVQ